ncbi:Crp/Fnr family transcriptional regulator [Candidatus Saccharibacteria bacterium]|jgi:CRP/FNR family transcriptional regulator|nr:Crp/Fnr family transcriptional regulator [Candidatus Saccharibacteria bacterium]HPR09327.1 Crp/Fnr family transcriptional regulator [Candidatus Saccharibacteria bacterium]
MLASVDQQQELVDFFRTGTRQVYTKGEYLVRPGDSPRGVMYIESGYVKAHDITKYGEENVLIIRQAGELVGLTFAVLDRDHTIIYSALSEVSVWTMPYDRFQTFLQQHPTIAVPILDMVTRMYHLHGERIMTLEYRTVRERLAAFLVSATHRFGETVNDEIVIQVPLRHQDIASSISATRETASRTMAEFVRKGYISQSRSHISVLNIDALKQMLTL